MWRTQIRVLCPPHALAPPPRLATGLTGRWVHAQWGVCGARTVHTHPTPPPTIQTRADDTGAPCPLSVGATLSTTHAFTQADISTFVALCGDTNPLHAPPTQRPLVPGLLAASLIPGMLGARHAGSLYASQSWRFSAPVYAGEEVDASLCVTAVRGIRSGWLVTGETRVGVGGQVRYTGVAQVVLPR